MPWSMSTWSTTLIGSPAVAPSLPSSPEVLDPEPSHEEQCLAHDVVRHLRDPVAALPERDGELDDALAEDVLALEIMNKDMRERFKIPRLVTKAEIERLKKTKVPEVWVYTKLPPFLPFILVGMLMSLLFAKNLLLL